jgi:hypothetical protein
VYIIAKCPRCSYRWWLDADAADRRVRCRKCFTFLRIPDLAELPESTRLLRQARGTLYVDDAGKVFG